MSSRWTFKERCRFATVAITQLAVDEGVQCELAIFRSQFKKNNNS